MRQALLPRAKAAHAFRGSPRYACCSPCLGAAHPCCCLVRCASELFKRLKLLLAKPSFWIPFAARFQATSKRSKAFFVARTRPPT